MWLVAQSRGTLRRCCGVAPWISTGAARGMGRSSQELSGALPQLDRLVDDGGEAQAGDERNGHINEREWGSLDERVVAWPLSRA